ncbi:hypothetical protein OsI_01749 [Oryza sativa Indica Group]|uniref:Uncharacterized protein n=1 Tax=Oryza sativa subsp. indica TaxID=39946 RepID=B8A7G9_ORYSI|nr:hypothetical protein OsI_01749 [Oryza sativa Indica Group]
MTAATPEDHTADCCLGGEEKEAARRRGRRGGAAASERRRRRGGGEPGGSTAEAEWEEAAEKTMEEKERRRRVAEDRLRRSPRFLGQEKIDLAYDTPRKKSKVQPISSIFSQVPKAQGSKGLPPIPVQQLQKIGIDQCGMLPEDVATDKLLKQKK